MLGQVLPKVGQVLATNWRPTHGNLSSLAPRSMFEVFWSMLAASIQRPAQRTTCVCSTLVEYFFAASVALPTSKFRLDCRSLYLGGCPRAAQLNAIARLTFYVCFLCSSSLILFLFSLFKHTMLLVLYLLVVFCCVFRACSILFRCSVCAASCVLHGRRRRRRGAQDGLHEAVVDGGGAVSDVEKDPRNAVRCSTSVAPQQISFHRPGSCPDDL